MARVLCTAVLMAAVAIGGAAMSSAHQAKTQEKSEQRPRARQLGIKPGVYEPGPLNAITDVPGVRVGQVTIIEGDAVRTGVTVILPHGGNLFREKVAGAIYVFNAFGKLVGATQVNELGRIETPIVLTNTLSVWDAAAAMVDWMLARPGNENAGSINPVVGETNDGGLNDIRGRHVKAEHVRAALEGAKDGPVDEGSVGAGTGTMALGWKGGIGTSSRRVSAAAGGSAGGATVGVLVQTNFGGRLTLAGVPVWKELREGPARGAAGGSCMIVVATDMPLDARQLRRLAARAVFGLARAGSGGSPGSGDYVIAFSTTNREGADVPLAKLMRDDDLGPVFDAVAEATEEAIDNSILKATTVRGRNGRAAEGVPIDALREILRKHGIATEAHP